MEVTLEFGMGRKFEMPEAISTERFYGLKDSLRLQLKAANYVETLSNTVFREKKEELRKQLKEVSSKKKSKSW